MKNDSTTIALTRIVDNYRPPVRYRIDPDMLPQIFYIDVCGVRYVRSYTDYLKSLSVPPRILKLDGQWAAEG